MDMNSDSESKCKSVSAEMIQPTQSEINSDHRAFLFKFISDHNITKCPLNEVQKLALTDASLSNDGGNSYLIMKDITVWVSLKAKPIASDSLTDSAESHWLWLLIIRWFDHSVHSYHITFVSTKNRLEPILVQEPFQHFSSISYQHNNTQQRIELAQSDSLQLRLPVRELLEPWGGMVLSRKWKNFFNRATLSWVRDVIHCEGLSTAFTHAYQILSSLSCICSIAFHQCIY